MKLLEVKDVTKNYPGTEILSHIELSLAPGESLAILGRSGSGKTTLLNLLAGLDTPDSGEIYFDQKPIHTLKESELAQLRGTHMGFVFQSYRLLEALTALENVCLPLELLEKDHAIQTASDLLAKLGLESKINQFPHRLSGGEQQRVAIARAIVHQPKLIIADEPTGNLDHRTGREVSDLLIESCKKFNIALLVATHDTELANKVEKRVELFDGVLKSV